MTMRLSACMGRLVGLSAGRLTDVCIDRCTGHSLCEGAGR
jgi:hypothetical protein